MPALSITEPHPSHGSRPADKAGRVVLGFSRGGAGNYRSYDRSSLTDGPQAKGPASRSSSTAAVPQLPRGATFNGIGGAGNVRPRQDRSAYDFDAELQRLALIHESQQRHHQETAITFGRGGAGNMSKASRSNSASSSIASQSSTGSSGSARRAWGSVRESLSRAISRE